MKLGMNKEERQRCPTVYPERRTWEAGMDVDGPPIITHNVQCEGHLYPCEICGSVRYCNRESRCLDDGGTNHIVRRVFNIDTYYGDGVKGWTRGENWNGWECPRFELAEAMKVAAENDGQDGMFLIRYDEPSDTFIVMDENNEDMVDTYKGEPLETPEGIKTVYAIGAWAWTWERTDLHD